MNALSARLAPNWTTAAGAVEGILEFLGAPLPRYAIMGLTGHAWHFHLAERAGVAALPSGPFEQDWARAVRRYARTGLRWERFHGDADAKTGATDWAVERLEEGVPLVGWDFHLHEFGVVYGYDRGADGFLVDDSLTPQVGAIAHWEAWPSAAIGRIELFAPVEASESDPVEAVIESLADAITDLASDERANTGTAGLERWAEALESDMEIDRSGNAYTIQVLQAARMDGADYLLSLRELFPQASASLAKAERHVRDQLQTLAPLITLFPFPTGGHGNVNNPGLREAAANALRRAAGHERNAVAAMRAALEALRREQVE